MCELKKAMARADEEATLHSSPALADDEGPPSSGPTRLHGQREATPFELAKTSLETAQERRLASNVDADEARADARWHYPIPPLPALEEFAPIISTWAPMHEGALPVPGVRLAATTKTVTTTPKRSALTVVIASAFSLLVVVIAVGIARGDLTREDAQHAAAAVQRVASQVTENVKRL